jgi:hypothetical protein
MVESLKLIKEGHDGMWSRFIVIFLLVAVVQLACNRPATNSNTANTAPSAMEGNSGNISQSSTPATAGGKSDEPRTVRDYFMRLPEKYFVLEGCDHAKDKDCQQAKTEYLRTFVEAEDTGNGYLKAGCDGAQSCLEMALFKRPNGTYLVGLVSTNEMVSDYTFLDYVNGKWTDVSSKVVPEFSKKNVYELPRYGTTVPVFSTKVTEEGDDYEIRAKDAKLYDLEWKDGKFVRK